MTKHPVPTCGARTRSGGQCSQVAGWGTDHVGEGRCKLHGGRNPIKHGRYSKVLNTEVRELVERMAQDPAPLDATPELALARALLHRWVDQYTELVDALLAWNAEEATKQNPRPARIPELRELTPLLESVSKAVKRIQDATSDHAISRKDFLRVLTEMGNVVNVYVEDPEVRAAIAQGWAGMKLG